MTTTSGQARLRPLLRPLGRPVNRALTGARLAYLHWIYLKEDIDGVEAELRRMRKDHARALRQFGAEIDEDSTIVGPISIVNARRDFSNLEVGPLAHIGSEVFIDLAERVTIETGATVSMRACIITHLDVGRGPLARKMPRETGAVTIGAGAFVGTGAIILHGVTVGAESVVPAGSVVRRDVPPGTLYSGRARSTGSDGG